MPADKIKSVKPRKTLLKRYLNKFDTPSRKRVIERLAAGLKVSRCYIRAMSCGCRPIPVRMALTLEKLTYGNIPAIKVLRAYRPVSNSNKTASYSNNSKLQRHTKAPVKLSQASSKQICKLIANKINRQ